VHREWVLNFAPIIGLGANSFTQIVCARILKPNIAAPIICGFLSGLATTAVILVVNISLSATVDEIAGSWLALVLTYIALSFGFWAFLNLNMTSLRIRVIREMLHAGGAMTQPELLHRYSPNEFLRRRLTRLVRLGQLRLQDGRYYLESRKLLYASYGIDFLRAVILTGAARKSPQR
jgi:hypothetical protein